VYRQLKIIAIAPVLDEEQKIGEVVRRVPRPLVDEVLVVDDGSTDRSPEVARALGARVLPMGRTVGVGAALRAGYQDALRGGFDVAVVMAGNNKDSPEEISTLLDPIADGRADFVQGSRFLKRDANFGEMPNRPTASGPSTAASWKTRASASTSPGWTSTSWSPTSTCAPSSSATGPARCP
jgi:dolichol-phosphate mannosyltransferase